MSIATVAATRWSVALAMITGGLDNDFTCESNVCKSRAGSYCRNYNECESGTTCDDGLCRGGWGMACSQSHQCTSNHCDAENRCSSYINEVCIHLTAYPIRGSCIDYRHRHGNTYSFRCENSRCKSRGNSYCRNTTCVENENICRPHYFALGRGR